MVPYVVLAQCWSLLLADLACSSSCSQATAYLVLFLLDLTLESSQWPVITLWPICPGLGDPAAASQELRLLAHESPCRVTNVLFSLDLHCFLSLDSPDLTTQCSKNLLLS